jgi:hypothetical protein
MLILLGSPEVLSRKLHLGGKKKEFEEFKEAEPWSACLACEAEAVGTVERSSLPPSPSLRRDPAAAGRG